MRGGLVVGACILIGNVSGFFRVAVTAYLLGTHARADALAVAIGPLDNLNSVIVNTMLFAFVPMLLLRQGGARAALFAQASRVFLTILAATTVGISLFAPQITRALGPGLAPEHYQQAVTLVRLFAPSTFFAGAASIFSALLYTERRFIVPGLYQSCLNGGTIGGALLLRQVAGVNGFAIGYTAGTALQLGLSWWFSRPLQKAERWEGRLPLSEILLKPGMFLVYAGLIAANIVATRAFATHAGPGMAAAFDYSIRCVSVVVAYLVYPVATTLVPEIARLRGTGEAAAARRLIDRSVGLMAIGSTLACVAGIALRVPAISLLFERGNFTADSTRLVSNVFLGFAPSLVGWALMELIARCYFALDRPRLPLAAAFVPVTINLSITYVLLLRGRLSDPTMLGLGASAGLLAGFAALFAFTHAKRDAAIPEPSFVGS